MMLINDSITLKREYSVIAAYDVIVCGGGPSGYIAAIAAARAGVSVALLERLSFFGGMATAGLVAPISEFNKNGQRIIDGIPWESMQRLALDGGADLSYPIGNVPYDPEIYKHTIQAMLKEANVDLYLDCTLTDCVVAGGRITHAICSGMQGGIALSGSVFVDCTGDAILARLAGVPCQPLPKDGDCQPATLCFRLGNVDTEHLEKIHLREPNTRYYNSRVKEILNGLNPRERVPKFGGPWFCWSMREGVVNVNMTRAQVSLSDPLKASEMICELRDAAVRLTTLLHKNVAEFKDCYLMQTAAEVGYRESYRILGAHVLTGEELLSGERFPDTIAASAHPVDIHRATDSSQQVVFLERAGYIPYRSLYHPDFSNYLAAGRCISADRDAFASVRVQAPCMAVGEAAGIAAALACMEAVDVRDVSSHSIDTIRSRVVLG